MTVKTEKDAREDWTCPQSDILKCIGGNCPAWRFLSYTTEEWAAATALARVETGEKGPAIKQSTALVWSDPARFGLPVGDERRGYCGLGGRPEVLK